MSFKLPSFSCSSDYKQQFFKVLKPGFLKRLSIPSLGEYQNEAIIKSCQGYWRVKVARRSDGKLSLEEGWKEFAVHHLLKEADSLLLKHIGEMVFHVTVYDVEGAEKDFAHPARSATKRTTATHKAPKGKKPLTAPSTPRRSSFNVKMSKTHRNHYGCLTIPLEFARSNGLNDKCSVILKRSGKEWVVELGFWKGLSRPNLFPRTTLKAAGWWEFYSDNELKDGDVCQFVLQDQRSEPVIMNVHVTRKIARA